MGSNDVSGFSTFTHETGGREADWASPPQTTGEGGSSEPTVARGSAALAALGPRPASGGPQDPAQAAARALLSVKCKTPSAPGVLAPGDNASKDTVAALPPAATRAQENAALRAEIFQRWRTANRRAVFPITDPDGPPTIATLQDYPGKPGAYLVVDPNGGPARFTATPRDDGKLIGAPLMKAGAYDEHGEHIPGTDSPFRFQDADAYGSPSQYLVTQRDKDISDCEKFDDEYRAIVNAGGIGKCSYREFEALYDRYDVRSIDTDTDFRDAEYPYVTIRTGREALSTEGVATCHSITLYGVNARREIVMMKYHDGGDDNVLMRMSAQMRTPGEMEGMAVRPLFFMIVGGQFGAGGGRDANTIARERILLRESDALRIPVRAARFHTTTLEFDENGNALEGQRSLSVATISTTDGVFYRDEDGSSNGGVRLGMGGSWAFV